MPPTLAPIDFEAVEDAIQAFFAAASGLEVYWADQLKPRGTYPYGTVKIISGPDRVGQDEVRVEAASPDPGKPGEGGLLRSVGNREITVSFQVFGPANNIAPAASARAYAASVAAAFALPLYGDVLAVAGLAVRGVGNPIGLPNVQVADAWFTRANLDVRLGLASNVSQPVHVIELAHAAAVGAGLGALDPALVIDKNFG